jgi:pimeloyl-ACP methyl ester carboxylesterase
MGADERLLEPQRALDAEIIVPPWIPAEPTDTLASYAQRLAYTIDTSKPFYLGGISLGGMLAYELAPLVGPNLRGLIIIVACTSKDGIPLLYRLIGRCVALLPAFTLRIGKSVVPAVRKLFGISTKEQARLFQSMLADADVHFLKWSLGAVLRWSGPHISPNIPTLTIAAGKDLILPSRRMRAAHVVESAGHTVNVTHAADVNRIIADWLAEQAKNDHRTYNQAYGQPAS